LKVTTGAGLVIHIGGSVETGPAIVVTERQPEQTDAFSKAGVQVQVVLRSFTVRGVRLEGEHLPPGIQRRKGKSVVADVCSHIQDAPVAQLCRQGTPEEVIVAPGDHFSERRARSIHQQ